jgi:hypothetical protein
MTDDDVDGSHCGVPAGHLHLHLIFTFPFIQLSPTLHATPLQSTNMTDLTPTLNTILSAKNGRPIPAPATRTPSTEVADEFLKEAHRIVSPLYPSKPAISN